MTSHTFVFLGGCTNSGTGLVRILLGKHPKISVLPQEGPKLSTLLPDDDRCGLPRRLFGLYPEVYHLTEKDLPTLDFKRILQDWMPSWNLNKPVLFEKCPANATRMRLLQAAFPEALFIGLIRNPYAVCEGIRRRRHHKIGECAKHWLAANKTMLEDSKRLNKFILIKYEDLTEAPKATLRKIFEFAGIENTPIDTTARIKRHNITGKPQSVKNLNKLSIVNLSSENIGTINKTAWPFANRFGYKMINR